MTVKYNIKLDTPLRYDGDDYFWFHPRVAVASSEGNMPPAIVMTLQKHLYVSDYYGGLNTMTTMNHGQSWDGPTAHTELDWQKGEDGIVTAVADVTPG